jgi:hypothetical protein
MAQAAIGSFDFRHDSPLLDGFWKVVLKSFLKFSLASLQI